MTVGDSVNKIEWHSICFTGSGAFSCNLYSNQLITIKIPDYRNSVIVARNPGSAKKATSYAERLRLAIAVIHGEQKEAESDEVDGRYSPPCLPK